MKHLIISLLLSTALLAEISHEWGEHMQGIHDTFKTNQKEIALTLDACGGSAKSSQYDARLINFLISNKIKATLFINSRWIDTNLQTFLELSKNPLFEIENHGTKHVPLSSIPREVYGIASTTSLDEVDHEIFFNQSKIASLTGKKPLFFRAGTAYYDMAAVNKANSLGVKIAGFAITADMGATLNAKEVIQTMKEAKSGDIILAHMNHPESSSADGLIKAIQELTQKGYKFVKLEETSLAK